MRQSRPERLYLLATLDEAAEPLAAEETLHRALQAAEVGNDRLVKVKAWTQLVYVVGYRLGHPKEARRWAAYADAMLAHLGDHPDLAIELLRYHGMIAALAGRPEDAFPYFRKALAIAERGYGADSYEAGRVHGYWAVACGQAGELAQAQRHHEREIAIIERTRGPDHPALALALNNAASTLYGEGDLDGARRASTRALAIWRRAYGPDNPRLSQALSALGEISLTQGRAAEALRDQERALALVTAHGGADGPDVPPLLAGVAEAQLELGHLREALTPQRGPWPSGRRPTAPITRGSSAGSRPGARPSSGSATGPGRFAIWTEPMRWPWRTPSRRSSGPTSPWSTPARCGTPASAIAPP